MAMTLDWTLALGLVVTSALVAMASLLAVTALGLRGARTARSIFTEDTASTVYLFDGEALVDATPQARVLLTEGATQDSPDQPWFRLLARLEPLFPGLATRLEGLGREGRFVLCSRENIDPPLVLRAEWVGGLTRLTLVDSREEAARPGSDGATELALLEELSALRETLARAPLPVWREGPKGEVFWANGAYLELVVATLEPGKELGWPLPALFSDLALPQNGTATAAKPQRRLLRGISGTRGFEVTILPAGELRLCYAFPVDQVIQAEAGLQDFKQTLAKTFAQLPIGLAIFDRGRVLQMFNPALVDLTGLAASFLVTRPSLAGLLDALRERKMIPEPRDYRSWRRRIVDMEAAAASGLFEETWTLPSGNTWRVTGRPHPNGALAFLIEDISSEMSRTRRYRADLELSQATIDMLDQAVVVFGQDGTVALSNLAARRLWQDHPEGAGSGTTARGESGAIGHWRDMTAPTLLWNDLAEYIGSFGPRDSWVGELRLLDGRGLDCRISPLPQGATLVQFQIQSQSEAEGDQGAAMMIA